MAIRVTEIMSGAPGSAPGSYSELDDRMLVLDFQAGNPEAFDEIHRRYHGLARHICQRILQNPEDADEATQEAMIRVFQGLGRFNGRYALQPWVARIATNVSLDVTRARARRPKADDRTLVDLDQDLRSHEEDPCEAVERSADREEVLEVLAGLPENHREALVLREFEGRSHKEIGDALGVTPSQAKALIHRAKGSFRRAWDQGERRRGLAALFPVWLLWPLRERSLFARLLQPAQDLAAGSAAAPAATNAVVTTGERVTAAAVAVLVAGTAAVGAVTLKHQHTTTPASSPSPPSAAAVVPATPNPARVLVGDRAARHATKSKAKPSAAAVATPSDSSVASMSPEGSPSPTQSPTPTVPPAPPWSLALQSSVPLGSWKAEVQSATVIGNAGRKLAFSETVSGPVTIKGEPPGRLYVEYFGSTEGTSGNVTLWIILDTSQGRFRYEAAGGLTEAQEAEDGVVDYTFTGSYSPVEWPVADDGSALVTADAPHTGSFQLDLRFWEDGTSLYKVGLALKDAQPPPLPVSSSS
jgi:RNA polymerase sigma-70 factor (ECF subfamily)